MRFECPFCHYQVSVQQESCGERVACPGCSKTIAVPSSPCEIGCIVGDFTLQEKLGAGSIGTVYRALQISLEREVALKILRRDSMTPKGVADFLKEARSAAKLSHSNLVQSYAIGEDGGFIYMAMTYVKGETLKARLKREGRIPPDEALHIVQQVAEALCYAWEESRLIHRDVKPENIMLTDGGVVKLTDLGLAMRDSDWRADMEISGSPSYMSPEQFAGEPLDTRSDIYSLGVTLYQMLTGELPFKASTVTTLAHQHYEQKPIPPNQIVKLIPNSVSSLVKKMLAKQPSDRFDDMEDLLRSIWKIRQKTAPNRSLVPDVHTISIKRLDYGMQKEYALRQKSMRKLSRRNGSKLMLKLLFGMIPVVLLLLLLAFLFFDNLSLRYRSAPFQHVDAFERMAKDPTIPLSELEEEAEAVSQEFQNLSLPAPRVKRYADSHIAWLLEQRRSKERQDLLAKQSSAHSEAVTRLSHRIWQLEKIMLPRLEKNNDELEANLRRSERATNERNARLQVLEKEIEALKSESKRVANEKILWENEREQFLSSRRNAIRIGLVHSISTRRFSFAVGLLHLEKQRSPSMTEWCDQMEQWVDFVESVYKILYEKCKSSSLTGMTQKEAVRAVRAADASKKWTDGEIATAYCVLCGNLAKAYECNPEANKEILCCAEAIADHLLTTVRTLHAFGVRRLPKTFPEAFDALPKTYRINNVKSAIGTLYRTPDASEEASEKSSSDE